MPEIQAAAPRSPTALNLFADKCHSRKYRDKIAMTALKLFLSHSSTDKAIVKRIYDELGAGLCHYDDGTFDPTGSVADNIFSALSDSTHFILFASPAAIGSPWVKGELARAFENWMRSGIRRAMVFLLDGAEVHDLPDWLRTYIMREPPTYRHILCRIQSEIDKESRITASPPFFRPVELQRLETKIVVEAASMPGAILVHGPDGSGRKTLINELYARQFRGVATRKLYINTSAYSGERELYRDLVGLTTIATPSDFAEMFDAFASLDPGSKLEALRAEIEECTRGNQCILIEGDNSLLTEEGRIPDWLVDLFISLAGKDYPRIALTTLRRPTHLPAVAVDKIIVQEISELDRKDSLILFNWWLKYLDSPYASALKDIVFAACSGSPRQLELGAKLLVQEGTGNISRIRPHLLKTLEGLSRQLLGSLAHKEQHATILAFVANAGYITRSDLTQYITDAGICDVEATNEAIAECASYGFLIEDEVCLRVPEYLVRGARTLARTGKTEAYMRKLLGEQAKSSASVAIDEVTSVAVLNEHCLASLRSGQNFGPVFESIILPSQCLQVARSMYEREKYKETYNLCERAYESRAALSNDGLIETLRYMGLAAARMGEQDSFRLVLSRFGDELSGSKKATRILHFLKGFNERLEGNYDGALVELNIAHRTKGEQDLHILRELAFINIHIGEIPTARGFINTALARASSNHYVLELAVRVELIGEPDVVSKRSDQIESLLEKLQAFDTSPDKVYWIQAKCEYRLALNEPNVAKQILDESAIANQSSPVIDLLRARILMKKKGYVEASKILQRLFEKTTSQRTGQRKSILPIICRWLVDANGAVAPSSGVDAFLKCQKYLPRKVAATLAGQLISGLSFTHTKMPEASMRILQTAAKT